MQMTCQDIRYGFRMVRKNPGFTAIVVLILGIGIGANTAIFSVVNAVMLRPLPYRDSHRIVTIWEKGQELFRPRSSFLFLREHNQVFESLAGYCNRLFYVAGIEQPHEVRGCEITSNLLSLLGVQPILGRGFLPEEEKPDNAHVVILSHAFWKDHLGGDPGVIGRSISLTSGKLGRNTERVLDYESYSIVGVMPSGFSFPFGQATPLWRPIVLAEGSGGPFPIPILPLARLKKGITLEKANADLAVLADRLRQMNPKGSAEGGRFGIERVLDGLVEGHRKLPLLLLGAAGFVLLIACGNVANLFLARAAVRQREVAIRIALGASRGRVMRQMLTESLLLSLGAGVLGLVLTFCTVKGVVHLCPSDVPRLQETSIDPSVLGFTLGVSVLTGLLFGVMPACRASDIGVSDTLKEGSGRTTGGRRWRRLHGSLVVAQLGLSLMLLIGAALLIRSLIALEHIDLGFRPENVLAMSIRLPQAKYTQAAQYNAFFQPLLERLRTLPHVRSAAALFHAGNAADAVGSTQSGGSSFAIPGQADPRHANSAKWVSVTPSFFEAMGIRLLKGRTFTDQDEHAIVIDEVLSRECFPDVEPIGQRLITDDRLEYTIVGVVGTVRDFQTPERVKGTVYARGGNFLGRAVLLVRADTDPMSLAPAIRMQVAELEKDQVIAQLEPFETTLSRMLGPRRFTMILLGLFAGIALTLATIGVYALLQYSTTQRTHDIGIRMALGARKIDILRTVVGQGLKLAMIGVVIGLAGAGVLTRVLSSLLYGVTATDPLTLTSVSIALTVIAALASYLPARRAAKIDPIIALRYE